MDQIIKAISGEDLPSGKTLTTTGQPLWRIVEHFGQIADTGDYDGRYEITNGKLRIFTKGDDDSGLEQLVNVLNEHQLDLEPDYSPYDDIAYLEVQLKEAKAQLESATGKAEWISVEDRLPEGNEHYFITCKDGNVDLYEFSPHFQIWETNYPSPVTHWMPVPAPPKQGKS